MYLSSNKSLLKEIENFDFTILEENFDSSRRPSVRLTLAHVRVLGRPQIGIPCHNAKMTISQFIVKSMKLAWINKDLIQIDVLEQLKNLNYLSGYK